MSIRIVTDSTADLPPGIAEQHCVTVVPLTVLWGDEQLRDGVDITAERFFRRLQRESVLPTTSQPSAGAFRKVYEQLVAEGADGILSIHISGKLSGTLDSARQGAAGLAVPVAHVDSGLASLALGLGVVAAAEAAAAGAGLDAARRVAEEHFRRTHCYFILDTLEYLRRGGRIGRAAGLVGSLLHIKPILTLADGEVVPAGRARTRTRAIEEALQLAYAFRPFAQTAIVHSSAPEDLDYLATRLLGIAPDAPPLVGMLGPVVGVHAGPGTLAFMTVSAAPSPAPPG